VFERLAERRELWRIAGDGPERERGERHGRRGWRGARCVISRGYRGLVNY
jgi:hypothetical protein